MAHRRLDYGTVYRCTAGRARVAGGGAGSSLKFSRHLHYQHAIIKHQHYQLETAES